MDPCPLLTHASYYLETNLQNIHLQVCEVETQMSSFENTGIYMSPTYVTAEVVFYYNMIPKGQKCSTLVLVDAQIVGVDYCRRNYCKPEGHRGLTQADK